jgi:hypothetical protein
MMPKGRPGVEQGLWNHPLKIIGLEIDNNTNQEGQEQ